jgi:hypothetical protein
VNGGCVPLSAANETKSVSRIRGLDSALFATR